jgi:hypothetical protein
MRFPLFSPFGVLLKRFFQGGKRGMCTLSGCLSAAHFQVRSDHNDLFQFHVHQSKPNRLSRSFEKRLSFRRLFRISVRISSAIPLLQIPAKRM